jgi:hypothetical protein
MRLCYHKDGVGLEFVKSKIEPYGVTKSKFEEICVADSDDVTECEFVKPDEGTECESSKMDADTKELKKLPPPPPPASPLIRQIGEHKWDFGKSALIESGDSIVWIESCHGYTFHVVRIENTYFRVTLYMRHGYLESCVNEF